MSTRQEDAQAIGELVSKLMADLAQLPRVQGDAEAQEALAQARVGFDAFAAAWLGDGERHEH